MDNIVISCFDLTGNMVMPWAEAGYPCYCVDIQHPAGENRDGNIIRVGADMRDWLPPFSHITFDPCDYAGYPGGKNDTYTKKTCLWTGGGFIMPPPKLLEPVQGSRMHRLPPSPERANLRSATPMGFARAVFEANRPDRRLA